MLRFFSLFSTLFGAVHMEENRIRRRRFRKRMNERERDVFFSRVKSEKVTVNCSPNQSKILFDGKLLFESNG